MKPLLVIGCGGHAKSVIDIIESTKLWEIIGLIGLEHEVGSSVLGHPIVGTDLDLPDLRMSSDSAVLALGQLPSPRPRQNIQQLLNQLDFKLPTLISPHAIVSQHSRLGEGSIIGHGAIVNANAQVGSYCTINTRALVEHDASIGDHCHISTGALVNGNVVLGTGCFIGSGSIIREGLVLPPDTVVSAGKRVMGWPLF